jgi:hypothetical protein
MKRISFSMAVVAIIMPLWSIGDASFAKIGELTGGVIHFFIKAYAKGSFPPRSPGKALLPR